MGRNTPSRGLPPAGSRKDARAKRAKQTLNKDIPAVLQSSERARKGVESSELITNPPAPRALKPKIVSNGDATVEEASSETSSTVVTETVQISLQVADTFQAAARLLESSKFKNAKSSRVAVLNMASNLRAGGGFLNGASAQEESLCMRSTLYPALRDEFYRLPEFGGIYTSDVLVFRTHHEGAPDLPKSERFFVDVVSSAMIRHPDVEEDDDGEKCYASQQDRTIAEKKMRAVMRMVRSKGVRRIVLGAWGCGAFGNPIKEVAALWKKVLLSKQSGTSDTEDYNGMEVVFAINDRNMAAAFARHFGDLELDEEEILDDAEEDVDNEAESKIAELEAQIAAARSPVLKERLSAVLDKLKLDTE